MVGMDHMAVGMDVDVEAGVESRKYAPMSSGFARSAALETGGVVQIADTVRVSGATTRIYRSRQLRKKLPSWRRRWLVWATTSLSWLARKFWRRNSTNSNGSSMARRKRQSISRPSKIGSTENPNSLEAETARLTGLQESLRVRKQTLKVAYEEIKILREDLLGEGESMDKNKSHFFSPEDTEEIRRLEQQELAFWRGSASKRLTGWTRDGSAEEIAGWMMEAQRLNREVEAKKRKLQEATEKESGKDARMGDDCHGWSGWIYVIVKGHTRILQEISVCQQHEKEHENSGLSNAATDPVSLKVLSWNVAGLAEDCADIFLSQISMLADWDVLLLQECFRKLDGVDVGVHDLFTPSELLGGLRCPAVIVNRKWKGQSKIVAGAARWTAVELDGQLTLISAHLPHKGSKLGEFEATLTEIQEFLKWEAQTTCDPGWRLQRETVYGMTDYSPCCEQSIPRPRTLVDTNDSLESESFTHDGDRTGFDGDNHVDECRHRTRDFHTIQLVKTQKIR